MGKTLGQFLNELPGVATALKPHHIVVRISNYDHISPHLAGPPLLRNTLVQHIVKIPQTPAGFPFADGFHLLPVSHSSPSLRFSFPLYHPGTA